MQDYGGNMNIKEASQQSGLPAKTIRYYEDIKLIVPHRSANGYRVFDEKHVHKLTFVSRARTLGFSIEDCRALLALYENKTRESATVRELALHHLKEIDDKIEQLKLMRRTLGNLVVACAGDSRPDCPILQSLAEGALDAKS